MENAADTVQGSLDLFLEDGGISKVRCDDCKSVCLKSRDVRVYPKILHLRFLTAGGYIHKIPVVLEKFIFLNEVMYSLIGATYGDGSHFIFQYPKNGKAYEADGMRRQKSSQRPTPMEAISEEISGPYEEAMAGRLRNRKTIDDVYYVKTLLEDVNWERRKFFCIALKYGSLYLQVAVIQREIASFI
jgi:hypothetical protein